MKLLRNRIVSAIIALSLVITGGFVLDVPAVCAKETSANADYAFNPHVCPSMLYEAYGEEYWTSFFNMCDALREGKDTFECASGEAYVWCYAGNLVYDFFPAAKKYVKYIGLYDGYSDGVGKIVYTIPAEEFVEIERDFEQQIEDVIRENVRKDDTDFEKCAALYKYIADNYTYDQEEYDGLNSGVLNAEDYGAYRAFMDKKGICGDLSSLYNYLLLQCGVDAYYFHDNIVGKHAWSYVKVDGVGYHVDPTWSLTLNDFMMPSDVREQTLAGAGISGPIYPRYYLDDEPFDNPKFDFSANDNRYAELRNGWKILSIDRERKVITYDSEDGVKEFAYGDL